MRHALLVLALVALAAPVAATGDRAVPLKPSGRVLAVESTKETAYLVRLDARTLKPVSKRLSLDGFASAWAYSPDRRLLAIGIQKLGIRILDARTLRRVAVIPYWNRGFSQISWPTPRRLIALEGGLVSFDPVTRKRVAMPKLEGDLITARRAAKELVFLVAPPGEIGTARLVTVEADGSLRSVTLEGIRAGTTFESQPMTGEYRQPGLAFAPDGRAYIVGIGDEPVAEVDLRTMTATYHRPERRRSLLARLHDWLEPQAHAKLLAGSARSAMWLGDGRIAVWGSDSVRTGPEQVQTTPVGLSIIDTREWTTELIDAKAQEVGLAAGSLLASGSDGGVTAYSTTGDLRYRMFEGERVRVGSTFRSLAFVWPRRGERVRILNAPSGRLVGTRRGEPWILHEDFSWW
jgi:WD40 repeat protein